MRSTLFAADHQENQSQERWLLQSPRMLRCALNAGNSELIATQGAMVAYQGQIDFSYQGAGGGMRLLKKMVTGEGHNLMRVSGSGEVFFARNAANIFLIQLEGDALTLNTRNVLAFDSSLDWDIRGMGGAGIMAGGLFNFELKGHGMVAVTSDGNPLLLDCSQQPTFVDPNAAVCWSANLSPTLKSTFKAGALIGRGSGEAFQLTFHGPGFVVVQPSEGPQHTISS
ncbi:AIM24 family protein [Dermabacteraceae bacterium P13115]